MPCWCGTFSISFFLCYSFAPLRGGVWGWRGFTVRFDQWFSEMGAGVGSAWACTDHHCCCVVTPACSSSGEKSCPLVCGNGKLEAALAAKKPSSQPRRVPLSPQSSQPLPSPPHPASSIAVVTSAHLRKARLATVSPYIWPKVPVHVVHTSCRSRLTVVAPPKASPATGRAHAQLCQLGSPRVAGQGTWSRVHHKLVLAGTGLGGVQGNWSRVESCCHPEPSPSEARHRKLARFGAALKP